MTKLRYSIIFSLFVYLALYISLLISVRNYTTIFIALLTLLWHTLANIYCAWISSYRFKNPKAKYIEIKNKFIKKMFVRPFIMENLSSASKHSNKTNIIGLVLNIINVLMLVSFEILLFMPKITCDPYVFTLVIGVGRGARFHRYLYFELHSFNEIIPAEASKAFVLLVSLIFMVFVILFERQLKEHRQKIERNTEKVPRRKPFKKIKWHFPLYTALIDISARRNNKKHKFYYAADQLEQIENLVKSESKNAQLKLERKGDKLISFEVLDTLNDHVMFTGLFL